MAGKLGAPPLAAEMISTGGSLISDAKLKQLYVTMVQCRLLTERARRLRKAAPYRASLGQEAIACGCVIDLLPEDSIAISPNDGIAGLVKGVPLAALVAQLYAPPSPSSAEGSQLSVATADALTNKRRKNSNVVVAFTGEATTNLPCWHDALKFAAKRRLPILFVVENNPWPGDTQQDEAEDFVRKARDYGLTGISVDGNDVVAVYRVAHESLDRVRHGDGPVLVEGKTYRTAGQRRLSKGARDPLTHMERYLTAKKLFSERWKQKVMDDFSRKLDSAIKSAR